MRIAIITFGFTESTLPLGKYLAKSEDVDYFVFTSFKHKNLPGLDLSRNRFSLGLNKVDPKHNTFLNDYLINSNLNLFSIFYFSLNKWFGIINRIIRFFVIRNLRRNNYDIVNFVGHSPELIYYHEGLKNVPRIHTFHEVVNHSNSQRYNVSLPMFNYVLNDERIQIIVHSKYSYKLISAITAKDRISNIPFGLFESYLPYKTEVWNRRVFTILFYGQIRKNKGIEILLDACKKLKLHGVEFMLIIAGKVYDNIKINVDDYVLINKYLTNSEIVKLNQEASIVICPYLTASQSGIPMTSYLFNKYIIASDVGAFREVIDLESIGRLVEPADSQSLFDAILQFYTNPICQDDIQKGIDIKFKEGDSQYSWDVIAKKVIKTYKELIDIRI